MNSADPVRMLVDIDNAGQLGEFFPELAALRMPLKPGQHHKDNWTHSLKVLENAIELSPTHDERLLVAAISHDVGKPDTRRFGRKGGVSFTNHDVVGAKMMGRVLRTDFPTEFINDVTRLIRLHMRAFGFKDAGWTDSAVRRLARDAGGDEQLHRLLTLFRSDLTTQNKRQRAKVLSGINMLEDALLRVQASDERAALRPALDGHDLMALTGLGPGRKLGDMKRFLESDEIIGLRREDALVRLRDEFPDEWRE